MVKALIVEDHKPTADVLGEYLKMFFPDWKLSTAITGQAAIDTAAAERPEIIILDIALADEVHGIKVVQEIARTDHKPAIVLVTALGNKAFRGPRPGKPWVDQLADHERALVVAFFEKTRYTWKEFLTVLAKAGKVPVPAGLDDL